MTIPNDGRVPSAPGSRKPSPDGLGPSGFDPSRDSCATCRHWRFDEPDWQFDDLRIGECKAVRMREAIESDALEGTGYDRWDDGGEPLIKAALASAKAIAVDGSGYYAALRTFGNFGCVLHAPRDSDGSPSGRDAERLDGEAATARAEGIAQPPSGDQPCKE